ncbi:MAG: cation-translocating P-type ATPase [bacterium]|nr:cation-translocating P-type ATPase [bacterium]
MKEYYRLSADEVISMLHTSRDGLKDEAITLLQQKTGRNELVEAKPRSRLSILLSQFTDVMILILIFAAMVSIYVGEFTDAYVIFAIIIGNALIGYSQETGAEESIRMLKKMSSQYSLVIRNSIPKKIEASDIVPGDVILLEAGDIVPADARLIEVRSFKTNESSLTGESNSVEKKTEAIPEEKTVPGDRLNMVFKGTEVSNGSARAVVTETGMDTELGKIADLLETGNQKTPLQKRLSVFSKQLSVIIILICIFVFVYGLLNGAPPFLMFLTALSLAVAALPEALPAVITIALSQGARRLVKQKALIRKLPAVETLGSVTYICSDKTGTLTQNVMTVEKAEAASGKEELFNYAMLLNNEVKFSQNKLLGDSTEIALVNFALTNAEGVTMENANSKFPLIKLHPFDSTSMRMSSLHQYGDKQILFVKGAPVKIAEILSMKNKEMIPSLLQQNRDLASTGLRVLFFAYKEFDEDPGSVETENENELEYLGMTAMIDPPREEVIDAIKQCKTAGIKTVMITGDQPLTAVAIAERLGMVDKNSDKVRTGADLDKLTEEEFRTETRTTVVYARVSPEQKIKIVKALQGNGEFVAMTGDGVNDAPSLKQADIGIAMGITGTDVSKEVADMILLDDNFATVVKAVKEGRRIYDNIRKFILYVLSCNLGEILTIFFSPILGLAIPLLPIHILWINLVTDGLPGLALVAEPSEKDIMNRPPIPPKESLFAGGIVSRIIFIGIFMACAAMLVQWNAAGLGYDIVTQQTAVFTTLCLVQLGNALSVRSMYSPLYSSGLFSNPLMWGSIVLTLILQLAIVYLPFLQYVFKTAPLGWDLMSNIILVTMGCVVCIELLKIISKRRT